MLGRRPAARLSLAALPPVLTVRQRRGGEAPASGPGSGHRRTLKELIAGARVPLEERSTPAIDLRRRDAARGGERWLDATVQGARGHRASRAAGVARRRLRRTPKIRRGAVGLVLTCWARRRSRRIVAATSHDGNPKSLIMTRFVFVTGGVVSSLGQGHRRRLAGRDSSRRAA